jgi:hypothetical protein
MTRLGRSTAFALALALAAGGQATAQDLNFGALRPDQRHVIHLGVAAEDAVVGSVGYAYLLPTLGRTIALTTQLDNVPMHGSNWRLQTGISAPLAARRLDDRWQGARHRAEREQRGEPDDERRARDVGVRRLL